MYIAENNAIYFLLQKNNNILNFAYLKPYVERNETFQLCRPNNYF